MFSTNIYVFKKNVSSEHFADFLNLHKLGAAEVLTTLTSPFKMIWQTVASLYTQQSQQL